jgi:Mg-chelatase subunit ChlD
MKTRATLALVLAAAMGGGCHRAANNANGNGDAGANGDGDVGTDDMMACAAQTKKAELVPLDLLVALDTSYSMDFGGKWTSVKAALESFITDPSLDGLGLGLEFFPGRAVCNVSGYASPEVPIQVLPGVASAITMSLESQKMAGGTPTVQILEGSLAYAQAWASAHPDRKTVIVLATDGIPDDSCTVATDAGLPNGLANAVTVAATGPAGTPKVPIFVIGVGSDLTALNQIAQAGGTDSAFFVDTAQDVQSLFFDALTKIRGNALSCEYEIPPAESGDLDFGKVNVRFTPGDGQPAQGFVYVMTKDNCAAAPSNGWYYDDPNMPTKVELCDDACTQVKASASGTIDVIYGCATIIL